MRPPARRKRSGSRARPPAAEKTAVSCSRVEGSAELELQRYLQSQHELARQLLQSDSLEEAAPGFIAAVARLLRWEAGAVWEVAPAASELRFVGGWDSGDLDAEPLWRRCRELHFPRGAGLPG